MEYKIRYKMETLFGLCGTMVAGILLILAAILTPHYNPVVDTVSSLGEGIAKSLFSIGFVIAGSLGIPFYIQLERELKNIKEPIRRLATGISIFSCMCIALVGIIPDETYPVAFLVFHLFVAISSFAGTSTYIGLYSYLMYVGGSSLSYTGPKFKRYLSYLGFLIPVVFITLLSTWQSLIEWILTILIFIWIFSTAIQMLKFTFFNIPGMYYKKSEYPEALLKFEKAYEILEHLEITDDPIIHIIQDNINFLKSELDANKNAP